MLGQFSLDHMASTGHHWYTHIDTDDTESFMSRMGVMMYDVLNVL